MKGLGVSWALRGPAVMDQSVSDVKRSTSKRIGSRMVFEKREKQLAKKAQESWRQRAAELVFNSSKFNAQRQMPGGERGDVDREDPAFGKSS